MIEGWTQREHPKRIVLEGNYCILEPLSSIHENDLYQSLLSEESRFQYLPDYPYSSRDVFDMWMKTAVHSDDPLFFSVVDKSSGQAGGRQSLMSIVPEVSYTTLSYVRCIEYIIQHGVIEIGHILWSSKIARTRVATESIFLMLRYAFDHLGYRRVEWKCNNENEPSKRAALRFGFTFEGVFRQHRVVKGHNRDTAWFSLLDKDWPVVKQAMTLWLEESNFDISGQQMYSLSSFYSDHT